MAQEHEDNDLFPRPEVTENWLKLTHFDPESVIKLGPVRSIKKDALGRGVF